MTLTTYAIDDEEHALSVLSDYIKRTPGLQWVGSSTDPLSALQELGPTDLPHLVFIDIDMPELNGLDLAGMLSGYSKVIFTTAHREYGPEAYDLSAVDYLLKPISYPRFLSCIQKIRSAQYFPQQDILHNDPLFLKTGSKGKLHKIVPSDVVYIEAAQNYMHVVTTSGKVITYMSIAEILNKLAAEYFIRVHKSFIINSKRIKSFEKSIILMDEGSAIPLGRAFRSAFFEKVPGLGDTA